MDQTQARDWHPSAPRFSKGPSAFDGPLHGREDTWQLDFTGQPTDANYTWIVVRSVLSGRRFGESDHLFISGVEAA